MYTAAPIRWRGEHSTATRCLATTACKSRGVHMSSVVLRVRSDVSGPSLCVIPAPGGELGHSFNPSGTVLMQPARHARARACIPRAGRLGLKTVTHQCHQRLFPGILSCLLVGVYPPPLSGGRYVILPAAVTRRADVDALDNTRSTRVPFMKRVACSQVTHPTSQTISRRPSPQAHPSSSLPPNTSAFRKVRWWSWCQRVEEPPWRRSHPADNVHLLKVMTPKLLSL